MKLADLPVSQLHQCLAGAGVSLQAGPFVLKLRTSIQELMEAIRFLYAEYPIADSQDFADYHVNISQAGGIRRFCRRQAVFEFNDIKPFHPMPIHMAAPLMEWGMNWSVYSHAHQYLMLHSAALERDGRALLLPAPSGSGKSTLCAGLACRGWRLLTDELTLVRPADSSLVPMPRPVSLKNESIDIIRAYAPEAKLSPIWRDTNIGAMAYMRPSSEAMARASEPAVASWIIFSMYRSKAPATLEPMKRSRAFLSIADNAVNYSVLGQEAFETLARLIDCSSCYALTYGDLDEAVGILNSLTASIVPTGI